MPNITNLDDKETSLKICMIFLKMREIKMIKKNDLQTSSFILVRYTTSKLNVEEK